VFDQVFCRGSSMPLDHIGPAGFINTSGLPAVHTPSVNWPIRLMHPSYQMDREYAVRVMVRSMKR